ncbi:MAG: gamma-glutamylcyclotransferase family protein [Pseudomonadota bacterium]
MHHLVFVFGTLKEGFPNFGVNRGTRVPGEFKTCAAYPLYLVGERHSPWLIESPDTGLRVAGQVFRVDREMLDAMDRLERVTEHDGYHRKLLQLEEAGSSRLVSTYAYLKPPEQLLMSQVRLGPIGEYLHAHAALYRARAV